MGSDSKKRSLSIKDRARIGPSHHGTKEQPDYSIFQSCLKVTQDLSKEVALYSSLVIGLGGSQDGNILREELRLIRLKSYNLAQQNIDALATFFQRRKEALDMEHSDVDKLLRLFSLTVEIFLHHLIRTIYLLAEFSFCNSSREMKLINTGMSEPLMGLKSSQALGDPLSSVGQLSEEEEIKSVERQVSDLGCIVEQIYQNINHRPWESPASWEDTENNNTRNNRGDSTLSFFQEIFTYLCLQRRQHRWFQIMILTGLAILVLSGCILGIYCTSRVC